jgi:diketogulonate reductase-like aldo/keto reductase
LRTASIAGRPVPIVGLGTWKLESARRRDAVAALMRGLDLGMTHIDTAEMYGSGRVEEIVAEAIAGRRDELFLVSKVLPNHASRAGAVRACEGSLARLRTDRLDLYLLHWAGSHPLEETIAGFEALRAAGKILAYGVSNFDAKELERAVAIAGPGRVAANQVLYHLEDRSIERELLPACERHGVAVVGYTPFGDGQFAQHPEVMRIAAARGITPHQVALAFLTRGARFFAIPKAASRAHVEENAATPVLDAADERALDAAFTAR